MGSVSFVGTDYVADLHIRSFKTFPDIKVRSPYDRNPERLASYCNYWGVSSDASLAELLESLDDHHVFLNPIHPAEHFNGSLVCLRASMNVYSEKSFVTKLTDAYTLETLAVEKRLCLASAPCSALGETAQTLWRAVRDEVVGKPLLVCAELDDDPVPQAPYGKWISESGAPGPHQYEFCIEASNPESLEPRE